MLRRFAILGHPLGHTMSPALHRRLLALAGLEGEYAAWDLPPGELEQPGFRERLLELRGFNVTAPYKTRIIPLLDGVDELAGLYQSVNTVAQLEDGRLWGYNTDADGFLRALDQAGVPVKGRVCIAGAGGVSRTFAMEATRQGADVTLAVRPSSLEGAEEISRLIRDAGYDCPQVYLMEGLQGEYDLFINATTCGMYPQTDAMPVAEDFLKGVGVVFDAIYNPTDTLLLRRAREAGCRCVGGMSMLVWQGAAAQYIWNRCDYSPADMAKLTRELSGAVDAMNHKDET